MGVCMNLAFKCEECQCNDNIQIGISLFTLCRNCQQDKFEQIYNVSTYEPKIYLFKVIENES